MVFKKKSATRRSSRAVSTVRRGFARRGGASGIMGSFKPMIDGGIAQIAASVGNKFLPTWGGIAGLAGTGFFMKNDTLMTIAGMHAAAQLPIADLIGGGGNGTTGGGFI